MLSNVDAVASRKASTRASVWRKEVVQAKLLTDVRSDIFIQLHELLEERNKLQELIVISIHKPALNGDPIGQLISKGLG